MEELSVGRDPGPGAVGARMGGFRAVAGFPAPAFPAGQRRRGAGYRIR